MRRLKMARAWLCYWLLEASTALPKTWQRRGPVAYLQWHVLLPYGGWWALRQNQHLPAELRREMRK